MSWTMGSSLRNVGRLEEAASLLQEAEKLYPHMPSISMFRALALHSQGRLDEALVVALEAMLRHIDTHDVERFRPALENYIREIGDEHGQLDNGKDGGETCES